jgi:GNAT superfamily N-acetyltransferase
MIPTLHPDMRVRCKPQSASQAKQGGELRLDRVLLAVESSRRGGECRVELVGIGLGSPNRREQVANHGTAEARIEELLDAADRSEVFGGVVPLPTCRSLRFEEALLLVVAKRANADTALPRKLTDSHGSIIALRCVTRQPPPSNGNGRPPELLRDLRGWDVLTDLHLPVSIDVENGTVLVRRAQPDDLHAIMRLLSDDPISAGRGDVASDSDEASYAEALDEIIGDPGNELVVVVDGADAVVGTLQLTLIPGMARRGSRRLLVEAVRVSNTRRSSGIGSALLRWVTERAAVDLGASLVQLTSDAARTDAHRFYVRLGFVDSHVGFKYAVPGALRQAQGPA